MTPGGGHTAGILRPLRAALYDWDEQAIARELHRFAASDAVFRLSQPFVEMAGPDAFLKGAWQRLRDAWPDAERRDWIVMAGTDDEGAEWIGCGGHYLGTFVAPLLDIPPSGHLCHMRFHEFYRIVDGRIAEMQAIWDLPEVMMQAGAWPMAPSLGRETCVPGPASGDGLWRAGRDEAASEDSRRVVLDMLMHLVRHPANGGPEVMEMPRFWHPAMNWYGPAGIGSARGMAGFRNWHQIPFLRAMPDRGQQSDGTNHHFFADNNYVAVTGWPNMRQTLSHDGWLGLAPTGQTLTLRSLDFWRVEAGLIRENWVLVDLLDAYRQVGIDVFARLREFNKARVPGAVRQSETAA